MGCVLGEVRDFKKKVAGLEVSQTGKCSLLEGLRINSQSSDHLELAIKEHWRAFDRFRGAMSLNSLSYSRWSIVRLSVTSLT